MKLARQLCCTTATCIGVPDHLFASEAHVAQGNAPPAEEEYEGFPDDDTTSPDQTDTSVSSEVTVTIAAPTGLTINGYKDTGMFVTKLKEGANAAETEGIRAGLAVLKIGGSPTAGLKKADVKELLSAAEAAGSVELVLKSDSDGYKAFKAKKKSKDAAK